MNQSRNASADERREAGIFLVATLHPSEFGPVAGRCPFLAILGPSGDLLASTELPKGSVRRGALTRIEVRLATYSDTASITGEMGAGRSVGSSSWQHQLPERVRRDAQERSEGTSSLHTPPSGSAHPGTSTSCGSRTMYFVLPPSGISCATHSSFHHVPVLTPPPPKQSENALCYM